MTDGFVTRGFVGRRQTNVNRSDRTPPGLHEVTDFPVLSVGPTPRVPLDRWTFTVEGFVRHKVSWTLWPVYGHPRSRLAFAISTRPSGSAIL
jgi:hypothetical protein